MSKRIHALAQQLFGKTTIEECNLQEIKNLVGKFPYFAPAQFLLLEKLKQEGSPDYASQVQKAILYYNDPLAFQYFINSDKFHTEISFEEDVNESVEEAGVQNDILVQEDGDLKIDTGTASLNNEQDFVNDDIHVIPKETTGVSYETNEPDEIRKEEEQLVNHAQVMNAVSHQHENLQESADAEPIKSEQPAVADAPSQAQGVVIQTSNTKPETGFTFEPYHTVDYFASQGIKLSQEEIPKDKFGKQLKSFTEWLKTMKRLPPTQMTASVDTGIENKVQHLANDSIHDSKVYTEAMAEVWAKQGNTQKAIEIYNKLVLLNPSKKAYFATKIENLKRS